MRWHDHKAEAAVIFRIAYEENEAPVEIGSARQALEDERAPDTHRAAVRIRRHRAQEQGRLIVEANRPVADGADDAPRFLSDKTEFADRRDAVAVAIGDLASPVGTEREIEQGFDRV